jgi:magnesium-transporting ATPase (P-type)
MQLIKGSKPLNNRFTVAKLVDVFFVLVSWRLKIVAVSDNSIYYLILIYGSLVVILVNCLLMIFLNNTNSVVFPCHDKDQSTHCIFQFQHVSDRHDVICYKYCIIL